MLSLLLACDRVDPDQLQQHGEHVDNSTDLPVACWVVGRAVWLLLLLLVVAGVCARH
jgi:hypothetical protein